MSITLFKPAKYHLEHFDFEQGSAEWLESRRGAITGSKFKDARSRLADKAEKVDKKTGEITPAVRGAPSAKARLYAYGTARVRCGGKDNEVFQSRPMQVGREQESLACAAYEAVRNVLVEPVGFYRTIDGLFGVSPDGLIGDDGVLEIKTMVSSETFYDAVVNNETSEFLDQCNGYLWLLGRKWVDLVLWAPDMADVGLDMVVHRIHRNEENIEALEFDLMAFNGLVNGYESGIRKKSIEWAEIEKQRLAEATTETKEVA